MKTVKKMFMSVLAIGMLAGCTDATAKLKDKSTAIMSIGGKNITKGAVYTAMQNMAGAKTAVGNATSTIAKAEVGVTDDIQEQAEENLEMYKNMLGDTFTKILEDNDMTEEDYLNEYFIPTLQAEQLPKLYVEEKFDKLCDSYKPVKAIILTFNSKDDMDAAKAALAEDKSPADAASENNSTSTGEEVLYTADDTSLDSMIRTVITGTTPEDGWQAIPSSDGTTFYLVKVTENDTEKMHDEIVTALSNITAVTNDSTTYFFQKYNFHIYDINLYNAVKELYPDNLVQDMKPEPTAEADSTASPDSN